jgi:hypothetical protein
MNCFRIGCLLATFAALQQAMTGPGFVGPLSEEQDFEDEDGDGDVDLRDWALTVSAIERR